MDLSPDAKFSFGGTTKGGLSNAASGPIGPKASSPPDNEVLYTLFLETGGSHVEVHWDKTGQPSDTTV